MSKKEDKGQEDQIQNYEEQVKQYEDFFPMIVKRLENIIQCDDLLVKFIVQCAGVCKLSKEKLSSQISQFFDIDNKEEQVNQFSEWVIKEIKIFEQQKMKKKKADDQQKDKRDKAAAGILKNAANQAAKTNQSQSQKNDEPQQQEKPKEKSIIDRLKKPERLTNTEQDVPEKKVKKSSEGLEQSEDGKKLKRCTFWPNCKNQDKCLFVHPTEACKDFPKCKLGKKCLYIHPAIDCKFGLYCKRKNCSYIHPKMQFNPYMMSMMKNPFGSKMNLHMNKSFGKKVFSKQQGSENKNQEKPEEKKSEDVEL